MKQPIHLSVAEYLAVEEQSEIVHRRKPEGGFAIELHSGPEAILPLPEIDAELPLADLYENTGG